MAHELAHQWWGDEVTCQTWHDIWLNEGLTSYSEALFREHGAWWLNGLVLAADGDARRPSNPDAQVYRKRIDSTGAIFDTNAVYNKAAWVMHMLRHLLGDDAFFAALADYRATFRHDFATTEEFATLISSSFGEDLTWFTEQWVMNPGSPTTSGTTAPRASPVAITSSSPSGSGRTSTATTCHHADRHPRDNGLWLLNPHHPGTTIGGEYYVIPPRRPSD